MSSLVNFLGLDFSSNSVCTKPGILCSLVLLLTSSSTTGVGLFLDFLVSALAGTTAWIGCWSLSSGGSASWSPTSIWIGWGLLSSWMRDNWRPLKTWFEDWVSLSSANIANYMSISSWLWKVPSICMQVLLLLVWNSEKASLYSLSIAIAFWVPRSFMLPASILTSLLGGGLYKSGSFLVIAPKRINYDFARFELTVNETRAGRPNHWLLRLLTRKVMLLNEWKLCQTNLQRPLDVEIMVMHNWCLKNVLNEHLNQGHWTKYLMQLKSLC